MVSRFPGLPAAKRSIHLRTLKKHFPYDFGNLVWWTDADLRTELKKRIPTLGDEMERNSPAEARVRTVLMQLLKEKGVQGEVQVIEPSIDSLSTKRVPEAPPVSIVYSVLSPPEIIVEKADL